MLLKAESSHDSIIDEDSDDSEKDSDCVKSLKSNKTDNFLLKQMASAEKIKRNA
jgi:hypothetical protein